MDIRASWGIMSIGKCVNLRGINEREPKRRGICEGDKKKVGEMSKG